MNISFRQKVETVVLRETAPTEALPDWLREERGADWHQGSLKQGRLRGLLGHDHPRDTVGDGALEHALTVSARTALEGAADHVTRHALCPDMG